MVKSNEIALRAALVASLLFVASHLALLQPTVHAAPQDDQPNHQAVSLPSEQERKDFNPLNLFDYETYKRIFSKSYSGMLENMLRAKMFMSRAFRVFISATKFRYRLARYHLSLNFMSDMLKEELDRGTNRVLLEEVKARNEQRKASGVSESKRVEGEEEEEELPEFLPGDNEDPLDELRRALDARKGEPAIDDMRAQLERTNATGHQVVTRNLKRRRRRDVVAVVGSPAVQPPRDLPLDRLISWPRKSGVNPDAELPAETRAKLRYEPPSNNPFYQPIELETQGLRDQQETLETIVVRSSGIRDASHLPDDLDQAMRAIHLGYYGQPSTSYNNYNNYYQPQVLPDQVFLDLRTTSHCFTAPRDQGECGACYAFAAIALAEWMHCQVTGTLVPFAEQTVIDCGRAFVPRMDGCAGGRMAEMPDYFHNFGFELLKKHTYLERHATCPYTEDTDLMSTGYIRGDLRKNVKIYMRAWPNSLREHGPLVVNIDASRDFREYGHGVYHGCRPDNGYHSVLLIGHGREDGVEYWLLRNSYGDRWGERGHVRVAKDANCIDPDWGSTFGSDDGHTITMSAYKNRANKKHRKSKGIAGFFRGG